MLVSKVGFNRPGKHKVANECYVTCLILNKYSFNKKVKDQKWEYMVINNVPTQMDTAITSIITPQQKNNTVDLIYSRHLVWERKGHLSQTYILTLRFVPNHSSILFKAITE